LFYSYPSFASNPPQPPPPRVQIFNPILHHTTTLESPIASNTLQHLLFTLFSISPTNFGNNVKNQTSKETPKRNRSQRKELQIPKGTGSQANPGKKRKMDLGISTSTHSTAQKTEANVATENDHGYKRRYLFLFHGGDKKTV